VLADRNGVVQDRTCREGVCEVLQGFLVLVESRLASLSRSWEETGEQDSTTGAGVRNAFDEIDSEKAVQSWIDRLGASGLNHCGCVRQSVFSSLTIPTRCAAQSVPCFKLKPVSQCAAKLAIMRNC